MWDFPDGPVVMTLHPTAQGVSSIPGQETKISACCMIHTAQRVCACVCVCKICACCMIHIAQRVCV